jgi:hypothetical protein
MAIELKQLRQIVALAEHGSFQASACSCNPDPGTSWRVGCAAANSTYSSRAPGTL